MVAALTPRHIRTPLLPDDVKTPPRRVTEGPWYPGSVASVLPQKKPAPPPRPTSPPVISPTRREIVGGVLSRQTYRLELDDDGVLGMGCALCEGSVVVSEVVPGTAAHRSGVPLRAEVVSIDGKAITSPVDVVRARQRAVDEGRWEVFVDTVGPHKVRHIVQQTRTPSQPRIVMAPCTPPKPPPPTSPTPNPQTPPLPPPSLPSPPPPLAPHIRLPKLEAGLPPPPVRRALVIPDVDEVESVVDEVTLAPAGAATPAVTLTVPRGPSILPNTVPSPDTPQASPPYMRTPSMLPVSGSALSPPNLPSHIPSATPSHLYTSASPQPSLHFSPQPSSQSQLALSQPSLQPTQPSSQPAPQPSQLMSELSPGPSSQSQLALSQPPQPSLQPTQPSSQPAPQPSQLMSELSPGPSSQPTPQDLAPQAHAGPSPPPSSEAHTQPPPPPSPTASRRTASPPTVPTLSPHASDGHAPSTEPKPSPKLLVPPHPSLASTHRAPSLRIDLPE